MKKLIYNLLALILIVTTLLYIYITESYLTELEKGLSNSHAETSELRDELSKSEEDLLISNDKLKQIEMRNEGIYYQEALDE